MPVAGGGPACSETAIAIRNVNVVDVSNGTLQFDQTVVVKGNRIAMIGAADTVAIPKHAEIVEGRGGYLIPGLWDMHVHGTRHESIWPIYVANGVTGVREMFGPKDVAGFRRALPPRESRRGCTCRDRSSTVRPPFGQARCL